MSQVPLPQPSSDVPIVYQDEDLLVVNKPAGMLLHRSRIATQVSVNLVETLRQQLGIDVYTVHRLDRATSGLVVFARSSTIAARCADQFAQREVSKTYLALVRGHLPGEGVVDSDLQERLDPLADKNARSNKPPQKACTRWRCLHQAEMPVPIGRYQTARYSLLEVLPLTGRKHQIRRHLRRLAHPIIGDRQYGDRDHNRYFQEQLECDRMLLAATGLAITHPRTGQRLSFEAAVGDQFQTALRWVGYEG